MTRPRVVERLRRVSAAGWFAFALIACVVLVVIAVAIGLFQSESNEGRIDREQRKGQRTELKATEADARSEQILNCLTRPGTTPRRAQRCLNLQAGKPGRAGGVGRQGRPGSPGRQGAIGRPGRRGPAGRSGSQGAVGLPCEPNIPECRGPQGETGAQGSQGAPGKDLTRAEVLEALRAFCAERQCRGPGPTDAQVQAAVDAYCAARGECRGPAGPAGSDGAPGSPGATGPGGPPVQSFTFTDGTGVTHTCSDPDGDGAYACT